MAYEKISFIYQEDIGMKDFQLMGHWTYELGAICLQAENLESANLVLGGSCGYFKMKTPSTATGMPVGISRRSAPTDILRPNDRFSC